MPSHLFCTFLSRLCATATWKCLISRFIKGIKKQRRNSIPLFELGYGHLKFSFRRVRLHLASTWVGITAMKTERTQIHFLSDILVAVTSLDLKGDVTRDNSQRRFLAQQSVAMLKQRCNRSKQYRNNVTTLHCAENRRCELSRVTSPQSP